MKINSTMIPRQHMADTRAKGLFALAKQEALKASPGNYTEPSAITTGMAKVLGQGAPAATGAKEPKAPVYVETPLQRQIDEARNTIKGLDADEAGLEGEFRKHSDTVAGILSEKSKAPEVLDPRKAMTDTERAVLGIISLAAPALGVRAPYINQATENYIAGKNQQLASKQAQINANQQAEDDDKSRRLAGEKWQMDQLERRIGKVGTSRSKAEAEVNDLVIKKGDQDLAQARIDAKKMTDMLKYDPQTRAQAWVKAGVPYDTALEYVTASDKKKLADSANLYSLIKYRGINAGLRKMGLEQQAKIWDLRLKQSANQFGEMMKYRWDALSQQERTAMMRLGFDYFLKANSGTNAISGQVREIDAQIAQYTALAQATQDPKERADLDKFVKSLQAKKATVEQQLRDAFSKLPMPPDEFTKWFRSSMMDMSLTDPAMDSMGHESDPLPGEYQPPFDSAAPDSGAAFGAAQGGYLGTGEDQSYAGAWQSKVVDAIRSTGFKEGAACKKGLDCSGWANRYLAQFGVRNQGNTSSMWKNGEPVKSDDLQPGDLVFFDTIKGDPDRIGHVGVYVGNGVYAHASGSPKKGYKYKASKINFKSPAYRGARRFSR